MSDPALNELRGEAARLIRVNLWQSADPPPSRNGKPWHMGRDLSMWNALVREGNDPETVNGAITVVRKLTGISGPMTLNIFYSNGGKTRPIFEQCKARWLNAQERAPKQFKDILRSLVNE